MYLITNRHLCTNERHLNVIKESILSGVENIILREKYLDNEGLEKLYIKLKETLEDINLKNKKYNVNLIINSNLDVFEKTNADGIHLTLNLFEQTCR